MRNNYELQWAITLGRYDILAHVMSLSRFRLAPKIGHLERMKRIYGYLARQSTMPSDMGPKKLITPIYQNKNMNGLELFMEICQRRNPKRNT